MGKHHFNVPGCCLLALLSLSGVVHAGAKDDPFLGQVFIDQFEIRDGDAADPWVLEGSAWFGKDLEKLWLKTEIEHADGETEEAELQALYSKAVAPYWDVQVGVRHDFEPGPGRNWGVVGLQGLAPYFFEVDAALFVGESGRTAARLEAEYELLLTQKWILSPEVELNFHGQNEPDLGIGSGLADISAGVRLRYEVRREFAPYIGVNWSKAFGNTADFAREDGEPVENTEAVIGIRAWF